MRIAVLPLLLLTAACSIPGIAPEGRDVRITHTEIPAARQEVFQKSLDVLTRSGYRVSRSTPAELIVAARALDQGRANIIEVRLSGTGAITRAELHGWTEEETALGTRKAAQYDASVGQDVNTLSRNLSCPAAGWPSCP
jgi:hypothetical protein